MAIDKIGERASRQSGGGQLDGRQRFVRLIYMGFGFITAD